MRRAIDIAVATAALLLLAPVIGLAALAVRLESRGPAIFPQLRVGRNGTPFTCYKLRSMYIDTQERPTHQVGSSAITRCGRILRRTKIDELPQLYNVLKGEMSLVGPRPCLPSQHALIDARRREGALEVLPGITGLAQVMGIDMSDPQRLAKVDGEYVRTRNLAGDFRLLLATITGSGVGVDRVRE